MREQVLELRLALFSGADGVEPLGMVGVDSTKVPPAILTDIYSRAVATRKPPTDLAFPLWH